PCERLPVRHERSRIWAQISPDQSRSRVDRIRLDPHSILETRFRCSDIVIRLLEAAPRFIESPAVIVASQAAGLDESVRQIGTAVSALPIDKAIGSLEFFVQNQIFTEQPDRLDADLVKLGQGSDGHPIPP